MTGALTGADTRTVKSMAWRGLLRVHMRIAVRDEGPSNERGGRSGLHKLSRNSRLLLRHLRPDVSNDWMDARLDKLGVIFMKDFSLDDCVVSSLLGISG